MQNVIAATVVLAGLFFSLVCGLLCEELIFGGVFRLLFSPPRLQRVRASIANEDTMFRRSQSQEGEASCSH